MKKLLLLLFGAFLLSASVSAKVLVPLTVCIEDDELPGGNGYNNNTYTITFNNSGNVSNVS
jgi:hypothetical protein